MTIDGATCAIYCYVVCFKMAKVDLDELLTEYESLRNACLTVDLENKKLKGEVNLLLAQCQVADEERKSILQEIANLRNIVCTQQGTLTRIANYEDENKELLKKVCNLKMELKNLNLKHEQEKEENRIKFEENELQLKNKMENMWEKAQEMTKIEKQKSLNEIELKNKVIKQLEIKVEAIEKETSEKIMQMQLQHEGKILQLQDQVVKLNKPHNPVGLSNMNDSFRKKLQHLQKDYEAKISNLQQRITELEEVTVIPESPKRKTTFRKWQA